MCKATCMCDFYSEGFLCLRRMVPFKDSEKKNRIFFTGGGGGGKNGGPQFVFL